MSNSIAEIEKTDVMFVIGSNTKENHPIVALRMIKAKKKGAKLIIADPRRVPLVRFADIWMQHPPGTDVMLLNAMMHVIMKEGLVDKDFIASMTEGYDEAFKKNLEDFTPEAAEKITGVPKDTIIKAARMYAEGDKAGIYYTMGITQHSHGTDNVFSVANLALMTGNLGKEGGGVNPLRGQNNVQGSTDMGCIPNNYPGYQGVSLPAMKEKFEELWKAKHADKVGMTTPDMLAAAETAALAHVVLPASSFAEKSGTFTNTDRRVQRVRAATNLPGQAMEDSRIIMELSKRMNYPMPYQSSEEVFQEIGKAWPAVAGMSYSRIDASGLQWPCPTPDHPGTPHLFSGGFPRGKGRFTTVKYLPSLEQVDKEFPFLLTTGRLLFH